MATTVKFLPVDLHTKIDPNDPKGYILQLFSNLFEGVGTMEDVQVHLDVDPAIEPVVQAPSIKSHMGC